MNNKLVEIGFISKAFGFKGELKCALEVKHISNEFPKFLWLYIDGKPVPFYVEKINFHNNDLIVKFEDIDNEQSAYRFKNTTVYCEIEIFNNFFEKIENLNDFIGFKVEDISRGQIGEIVSIIDNTIQPTLVLNFQDKEILIPFAENVILEIDEDERTIKIDAPNGLIDLYLE